MASSSAQDRTEQATPHKLREARKKGQVAVSRDATTVAVLLATTMTIGLLVPGALRSACEMAVTCFRASESPSSAAMLSCLTGALATAAAIALPTMIVTFAAAGLAVFLQVGPLLTLEPLTPKLERLNPIEGIKGKFKSRTFVELAKTLIKLIVCLFIAWAVVEPRLGEIVRIGRKPPLAAASLTAELLTSCALRILVFLVAIAACDLLYQKFQFLRDQRMSKDEVKREHKQQEGDPHHKAARKQLHRELAMNDMLQQVRARGDVVTRNPTHIACVLAYDPANDGAPRLIAKGTGWLANEILRVADEERIPTIRDVPLARALNQLELEQLIPAELFAAAAVVLRWAAETAEARGQDVWWRTALDSQSEAIAEPSALESASPATRTPADR